MNKQGESRSFLNKIYDNYFASKINKYIASIRNYNSYSRPQNMLESSQLSQLGYAVLIVYINKYKQGMKLIFSCLIF